MANTIRGNTYIIDTVGSFDWPGGGAHAQINSIAFWGSDTTGVLQLTMQNNSSDVVVNMRSPLDDPNMTTLKFAKPQYFGKMHALTVTAGTGYLYFA